MIDLSYLTEEEQGAIMTVVRRDVELKKAEEDRIRKLEKILNSGSQSDTKLKYLSGEWFYEAKSRRHTDKIHGSEIILASIKQRKALEGSLRIGKSKTSNSQSSDIMAPPKPARFLEALQPQDINGAKKENPHSRLHSPRMPRQNPFNRALLIAVDPPENNNDMSTSRDQESPKTEIISPLKNHPVGESSQTSGGSVTSEGSSVGFRPVPKKRMFLSGRSCSQSESSGLGLDAQVGSAGIVPAPRRSLQQGSSGSSNQSYPKSQNEMPQESSVPVAHRVNQSAQPSSSADAASQQPLCNISQVSSNSILERLRSPPSSTRDRPPTYTGGDVFSKTELPQKARERDDETQREHAEVNTVIQPSINMQDSDRENNSSVAAAVGQKELSFTHSTVDADPPVSYDLNFIDKSDQQMLNKSNQRHVFKLSTQASCPTADEEDSIAKVLDWFSRSTDSIDWLKTKDSPEATKSSDKCVETSKSRGEDSLKNYVGEIISDRKKENLEMENKHPSQRHTSEAKELRAIENTESKEPTDTQKEVMKDVRERMQSQEVKDNDDEGQPLKISHLKSFWEKSNSGPKILISKSITPSNIEQKPVHLPVEKEEENMNKPHRVSDMPSGIYNGKGLYDKYTPNHVDERDQQLSAQKDTGDSVHFSINQQEDNLVIKALNQRNNNNPTQSTAEFQETPQQEELPKTITVTQLNTDLQTRGSPVSESLYPFRNSPYVDSKQGGNDVQIGRTAQMYRLSSEDAKPKGNEDKSMQSNMSSQSKEDTPSKDSNRHGLPEESMAERIKQLKSFWEQERNNPMFYSGKPKTLGDGKVDHGANQARLNKRFTKSEHNLSSIGNDSDSDNEDSSRNHHNFTVLPLNQRIEKLSPSLSTSRAQFNTLREFWDEATSDTKGFMCADKPKPPHRKESLSAQLSCQELKCDEPEIYSVSSAVEKTMRSSLPEQNQSKLPHVSQTGSRVANDSENKQSTHTTVESKRSSKRSNREEKAMKPQSSSGKETCPPKGRKDSCGNSSSRGNSLRRATSMFALSFPDENHQDQLIIDVSPVQSLSRKQRQNTEKEAGPGRASEQTETVTPRARVFVPTDYRHYLGMTDKTSVHTSLAPTVKDEGSEGRCEYEFDLSSPVRASTPVSLNELHSRKGSQRPLRANYSSSDTGQESSISSTSETWSISRNGSNWDNDDENSNPVRKALRRAEARPKNLTESMEDITAFSSPHQERSQNPTADMRHISGVSSIPSPSSFLFSDPDHMKKMSKSVPSVLEKEDDDSTCEDSYRQGKLMMGRSMTNLTNSSGMTSVSSLSGSVMTMYSGDFGNIDVQGNIQFSINYIQRLREFHIFVAQCRDLAAVDQKRGRSDPYVKSYLVPDKANLGKRKTSVKKKTLNPTFNEILRYRVRMEYLQTQTLILSVWHHDTFGRNTFLGEVDVDLSNWDFDHTQMNYLALKPRTTPALASSNDRGEMRLAVRFLPEITRSQGTKDGPSFGEIHIWVKECKNLPLIRATIDPYVKCFVLPDTSRKSRQKTRVVRRTADPVFNHTMVYDGIREADLTEACVELTVWDRDRLASNLLGGLRLGAGTGTSYGALVDWMDSTSYEVALWERMTASPNEWVEDVLPLRMLSSAKTPFK